MGLHARNEATIAWRRVDIPGRETARLDQMSAGWRLSGSASFTDRDQHSTLSYVVECDDDWRTRSGRVTGSVGGRDIVVIIDVDAAQRWRLNGIEVASVAGCVDLDLNFSPSTNLLPIRRLHLGQDQEAELTAAWLRFPSFALEPLVQRYRRTDQHTYRYESAGGAFARDLTVNDAGFVTVYPGFWEADAEAV